MMCLACPRMPQSERSGFQNRPAFYQIDTTMTTCLPLRLAIDSSIIAISLFAFATRGVQGFVVPAPDSLKFVILQVKEAYRRLAKKYHVSLFNPENLFIIPLRSASRIVDKACSLCSTQFKVWLAQPDLVNESERLVAEKAFKQVSEAYAQLSGRELLGLLLASICVNITKLSTLLEVRALCYSSMQNHCVPYCPMYISPPIIVLNSHPITNLCLPTLQALQ